MQPPPQEVCRWETHSHDNGAKESFALANLPGAAAVRKHLDSDEFYNMLVVRQFISRSPAADKMRVLFAFAQTLAIIELIPQRDVKQRAMAMWPARDEPWKDPQYPNFPSTDAIHYSQRLQSYVSRIMMTNVVELYVSASTQAKDYPHLTLMVPVLDGPKPGAYVARIALDAEPPQGVMTRIRRRIDGETACRTATVVASSNPFRAAHATSAAATAHSAVPSTARMTMQQVATEEAARQRQQQQQQYAAFNTQRAQAMTNAFARGEC